MNRRKRVWEMLGVASLLLLALSGCAGFWDAPDSTTTTSTTLSSGYFYVLDASDAKVLSYYISSGSLTLAASKSLPATPTAFAMSPDNSYMYVGTDSGIFSYKVSSGTLTLVSSSAISSDVPTAMAVDTTGAWLLEGYGSGTYIYLTAIPVSSGVQKSGYSSQTVYVSSSAALNQIAVDPNDDYLFLAAGSYGTETYLFTSGNTSPIGNGSQQALVNSSGAALSVAVDPSARMVYVGESDAVSSSGGLRAFTYSTSSSSPKLTEISGSPYSSGGTGPHAILPISGGDTIYVANWNGTSSGVIDGFTLTSSSSTYTLTKLSTTVSTGIEPSSMVEDADDNFVIVGNTGGSPYLDAYIFDTTTSTTLDLTLYNSTYSNISVLAAQ